LSLYQGLRIPWKQKDLRTFFHRLEKSTNNVEMTDIDERPTNTPSVYSIVFILVQRLFLGWLIFTGLGILVASIIDYAFVPWVVLLADAIFVLGPLGLALGLISAAREIFFRQGLADTIGRKIYKSVAKVIGGEKNRISLRSALETMRRTYSILDSVLTSNGIIGWIARKLIGYSLPASPVVISSIIDIVSSDASKDKDDVELITWATSRFLDAYVMEKSQNLMIMGLLLYSGIASCGFLLDFGLKSFVDNEEEL
jgi:hypothetical protein